ncbi:MAG: hypothetical protein UY08_C0008G0001 [Candidatus Gottesmanbacteria bacterium GW2011_GWA1_47_8]|uniref:Uncharacterized protein n=1 Tax=Candidatus Gottesmanbacteria bacterium GW2011_GWA1_47_8 TaxID=1618438 RepID=A0A0G1TGD0_9BACT|nr:MAG: hypothetical protein UY08_C0008G0001 [Candidatus Gottesmanbacteria bacterium GW2011_GWA1_47_8]
MDFRKKNGASATSGSTPKKAPKAIVIKRAVSGRAVEAMKNPAPRLTRTSRAMIVRVLVVILPCSLISRFRWGFQWGTRSNTKWLAKASGRESAGFPTFAAMAAPTTAWGSSIMC